MSAVTTRRYRHFVESHWWLFATDSKPMRALHLAVRLIRGERQMTTNHPITLTAGEAAGVLGLSPSTLAKLRLSGNGPVYCKLGRRVVYRREDLTAWLNSRVARDTSDADARLPKSLTGEQRNVR